MWNPPPFRYPPLKKSPTERLEFPSRVRLGSPKPRNSRHPRLPEHPQNSFPPSTAGGASFFRSGSGEGLSEVVMEFPAALRAFLTVRRLFGFSRDQSGGLENTLLKGISAHCRNYWNPVDLVQIHPGPGPEMGTNLASPGEWGKDGPENGKMTQNSIFEPFSGHFFHFSGHFSHFQAIFPHFSGEAKIHFLAIYRSTSGQRPEMDLYQVHRTPTQLQKHDLPIPSFRDAYFGQILRGLA